MAKYEDTPLTNFPDAEDNWARMSDINATLLSVALQYNSLWEAGQIDEANALLDEHPELKNTIFNADKWNKIRDAIIALQRYYLNDVTDFIEYTAQAAIGINDKPIEGSENLVAYSAERVDKYVENIEKIIPVTFPVSGWSGSAPPYTQTINVESVTEEDEPMLVKYYESNFNTEQLKAYNKAFGFLADGLGETGDGTVTWQCIKKPLVDITVGLKGFKTPSTIQPQIAKAVFSNMKFTNELSELSNDDEYAGLIQGTLQVSDDENVQARFLAKINNEQFVTEQIKTESTDDINPDDIVTGSASLGDINEDNIIAVFPYITSLITDAPGYTEDNFQISFSIRGKNIYYNVKNIGNTIGRVGLSFMVTYKV